MFLEENMGIKWLFMLLGSLIGFMIGIFLAIGNPITYFSNDAVIVAVQNNCSETEIVAEEKVAVEEEEVFVGEDLCSMCEPIYVPCEKEVSECDEPEERDECADVTEYVEEIDYWKDEIENQDKRIWNLEYTVSQCNL